MGKLCLIYNTAPRYRAGVFRAIDAEYDCDWYFGVTKSDIKEMDTSLLRNVKYYKPLGNPNKLYWKRGVLKLLFKKEYQNFFMLAEVRSITDWLFFWLASKFSPIRESIYRHMVGNGKKTGIDAKMKLWLYRNVTGTFVYGDRAKKHLIEKGINENSLSLDERAESKQYNSYLCDLLSSDDKYWSYLNGELKKTLVRIQTISFAWFGCLSSNNKYTCSFSCCLWFF